MPAPQHPELRSRPAQRADRAAVAALIGYGLILEPVGGELQRLFELDGRIVAACRQHDEEIAPPIFRPEPIGPIDRPFQSGSHRALVGTGFVLAPGAHSAATRIHRLARTLLAQERGCRYCVINAPLPEVPSFDPGGITQQIAAGSIDHLPVTLPLLDGYWPIGTIDHAVTMVLRNEAF